MELVDKVIANEKTPAEMKALCEKIKAVDQYDEKGQGVEQMRALVKDLKKGCEAGKANGCPICAQLLAVADNLVRKSVWVLGGDGWAYDIGYGGLDHVLASGKNIKILVMDTEVYSNTGGQASKAGAIAKFAASGKVQAKKNLGLMQMQYKNVYVAYVSMGTNPAATVKAFNEAENYNGPAIIIAYAHCIEQGLLTKTGPAHQKAAVESVHFPLWTYNPTTGKVKLDSADKSDTVSFAANAQEDRPGQGDGDAQGRRAGLQGQLRPPQEALRDVSKAHPPQSSLGAREERTKTLGAALVPRSRFLLSTFSVDLRATPGATAARRPIRGESPRAH